MMKNLIAAALLLLSTSTAFAHFMWIETNPSGSLNRQHEVRVYFGEYTYGVREKVAEEAFAKMKNFEVWVVSPEGKKSVLQMTPGTSYYSASFTPEAKGTYTVVLNNNKIDVIDYTQYDFGIFKTHYHSVAKVQVGGGAKATVAANPEGLTIIDMTNRIQSKGEEALLQLLYKGQPIKESEVTVFINDQWSKKVYTDEKGMVRFLLPWDAVYVLEATKKEEVPGTYNGKPYQFVWHCATYRIDAASK